MYLMKEHTMLGVKLTSEPSVVGDAVDDLLVVTVSDLSFGTRGNLLKTAVIISHPGHCAWSLSVPFLINPLTPLSD